MRRRGLILFLLLAATPALPCSICRCGDVTFNALGPDVFVVIDLGRGLVGRAGIQIPLVRALYGEQTERSEASLGLTYLF